MIALAVANCAGSQVAGRKGGGRDSKYGVAASPRVIPEGEPIPKGGGRAMVGQPYVVGGRTYVPTSGRGYEREGWASWYGTAFHGRLTANGEIFDRESIAAAHPTLPLPSYVRVTNLVNKRSMIVRVNDRGPYEQSRLIDVSERVADALDFRRKGTSRVRVEYVGKASTRGSDDEKLLASLRTDGSPAPFGRARGPVMLADLQDDPPPRAPALAYKPAEPLVAPAEPPPEIPTTRLALAEEGEDGEPAPVFAPAAAKPPVRAAVAQQTLPEDPDEALLSSAPLPPRRPAEAARVPAFPGAAEPRLAAAPRPIAAVELLPPQKPALAGIY